MRLLFLDFDGVLNSDVYFSSSAFLSTVLGHSEAERARMDHAHYLDPSKVAMINALTSLSGVRVVICSSWRQLYSLEELNDILRRRGATFVATAITPRVTGYDPTIPTRAREIMSYLKQMPEPPEAMVALDDEDLEGHVPRHVRPDGALGLQPHHVDACLRFLMTPLPRPRYDSALLNGRG